MDKELKPAVIDIAKIVRVYSGWDIGEEDCIRIAEQIVKEGYTRPPQEARLELVELDREKVAGTLYEVKSKGFKLRDDEQVMIMEECYREADFICTKFGTLPESKKECEHRWINAQDNNCDTYKLCLKCNQEIEVSASQSKSLSVEEIEDVIQHVMKNDIGNFPWKNKVATAIKAKMGGK